MKYIKNVLFLVICLGLGYGIAKGYLYWKYHPKADFSHYEGSLVTGTGDAPGFRGFYVKNLPATYPKILDQWRDLWATTIAIEYSPSLTREVLTAAVKAAHRQQMAVVLLPPPVPAAANPYPRPLVEIATEAQAAGVDTICISWLNTPPEAAYWRKQEAAIRAIYKGKLILAATVEVLPVVTCWDVGDYIGIAGPIQLPRRLPSASDKVSMQDFRIFWSCHLTTFDFLAKQHEKPVALLNLEVSPHVSVKLPLPGQPEVQAPANAALQALSYEALFIETKGRSATTHMLLVPWSDGDAAAVNGVAGLLPKLAAAWDPKKPRRVEVPQEPADPADAMDTVEAPVTGPAM